MNIQQAAKPELAFLGERLGFSLYSTSKAVFGLSKPYLDKIGLTYPQYLVLVSLFEHVELTIGELSDLLFLDMGTTTPLLKRMEQNGLLTRVRSKTDERVVKVQLTKKGLELRDCIARMQKEVMFNLGMDPDQAKALRETLKSLNKYLRRKP